MPPPRRGGIKRWSASVVRPSVRPSVRLMSRTSALTRKPKGLGRRNFAQGYPRSHATPTPTSRSKGQKSRWGGAYCGGDLAAQLVYTCERPVDDGIKWSTVDVYEDSDVAIWAAVNTVEIDAQTEFVAGLAGVEARTVYGSTARRLRSTSLYVSDRPHVRTNVLPTTLTLCK